MGTENQYKEFKSDNSSFINNSSDQVLVSSEILDTFDSKEVVINQSVEENYPANMMDDLESQLEQMMVKNEGLWKCKVCGQTAKQKNVIKDHTETHLQGISHTCHICNRKSSTRKALQVHINNFHSQLSFNCQFCGKERMTKNTFRSHKRSCKL